MAVHRVPLQMMGIMPKNTGEFGGVEKKNKIIYKKRINTSKNWGIKFLVQKRSNKF